MSRLLEPFQFSFMVDAMLVGVAVGAVCAVLSCYLVLKGWSLMGDAISHAVLPGIVVAYALGVPLALGAFGSGLLCAVLTGYIKANTRVKEDTVMGVVFTGLFAFGLVLFTKIRSDLHLDHILFGNMLGVGAQDLWTAGLIALGVSAVILAKRREFMLQAFDPVQARAVGLASASALPMPTAWLPCPGNINARIFAPVSPCLCQIAYGAALDDASPNGTMRLSASWPMSARPR